MKYAVIEKQRGLEQHTPLYLQIPQMNALSGNVEQGQPSRTVHRERHNRVVFLQTACRAAQVSPVKLDTTKNTFLASKESMEK